VFKERMNKTHTELILKMTQCNGELESCTDFCEKDGKIDMDCINTCGNEYLSKLYQEYDLTLKEKLKLFD
jgi:hypothetical protein